MNTPHLLYHDTDIFAVYKPSGIHSVRLPSGGGESVADWLLTHDPRLAQASRSPGDAGLVQRLDYETSGVLLGANNRGAWNTLFTALMDGRVDKRYVAIVDGEVRQEMTLSSFLGSPNRRARKVKSFTSEPPASARALPATTTITPLRYLSDLNVTLIEASAPTARRHQIRAHAALAGHPLVGDSLYGSSRDLGAICTTGRNFFLHAWRVQAPHPTTQVEVEIVCDYHKELPIMSSDM